MAPRFDVCTLDLDGTLLRGTCFLAIADAFGKGDAVRRLDAELEAGRMSLEENFEAELALLAGIRAEEAIAALRKAPWLRGIPEGVAALRGLGLRVGLLTDQPRFLAEAAEPGLEPLLCSEGGVRGGVIAPPVEFRGDKLATLRAWCRASRVSLERVVHCGNGANDVPVFERVGLAVAVNPSSPEVARRADVALEGLEDLRDLAAALERALRGGS